MPKLQPKKMNIMGMIQDRWTYKSCFADFGVGEDYATLYMIQSKEEGKGHARKILIEAKEYYEKQGKVVYGSHPLNPAIAKLYIELGYKAPQLHQTGCA